jgi:predicted outer membrane repeat protein
MSRLTVCALVGSLLLAPAHADATVIHVDVHGGGDYTSVAYGIAFASDGDTVLVASGTYYEPIGLNLDTKNLVIMSEEGPDSTIIDQQLSHGAFEIQGGQDSTTVIEGFTIANGIRAYGGGVYTEGTSPTIRNCVFSGNQASGIGGAIAARLGGHPTVSGSTFESNTAPNGGGAVFVGESGITLNSCSFFANSSSEGGAVSINDSPALVEDCTFGSGNIATDGEGGGLLCAGGSLDLRNSSFTGCGATLGGALFVQYYVDPCSVDSCQFVSNTASEDGGAVYARLTSVTVSNCGFGDNHATYGGAAHIQDSPAAVTSCTFLENGALSAGAIRVLGSTPAFTECLFLSNTATDYGGAVMVQSLAAPVFEDCLFYDNSAGIDSGALSLVNAGGSVTGCTFAGNAATFGAAGIYFFDCTTVLTRNVIAFSPEGFAVSGGAPGTPAITHCVVFENAEGDSLVGDHHDNMFSSDPRFCGLPSGDCTLCSNSPCLAANNAWSELIGCRESGCGDCNSAVERASWGRIKSLYR